MSLYPDGLIAVVKAQIAATYACLTAMVALPEKAASYEEVLARSSGSDEASISRLAGIVTYA